MELKKKQSGENFPPKPIVSYLEEQNVSCILVLLWDQWFSHSLITSEVENHGKQGAGVSSLSFFFTALLSGESNNGPQELLSMDLKSTAGNTHEKQPGTHWSATLKGVSHPLHSASLSGWLGRAVSCETIRYFIYEYVLPCVLVTALLSREHSSHTKISDEILFSLWWKNIDNYFSVWTVEVSLRLRGAPDTALCRIDCFSFTLVLYCEWNRGCSKIFNCYFP